MVGRRSVFAVTLRHARGDRARVLVCDNEINGLGDGRLIGLDVRRRIALIGGRALHSQGGEAAHEPHLLEDALRMPGVVHVPHEKCRLGLTHEPRELVGDSLELPHSPSSRFRGLVRWAVATNIVLGDGLSRRRAQNIRLCGSRWPTSSAPYSTLSKNVLLQ